MTERKRGGCGLILGALSALLLCGLGLTACGKSTADDVVARVGRTSITSTAVGHWMSVIAGEGSTAPVPSPPSYSSCIAYRRRSFPTLDRSENGLLKLKRECELDFRKYRLKALYFLISYAWVSGAAAEMGVRLSNEAVQRQRALIQSPGARTFLVGTRGTVPDALMRIRLSLLTTMIQQKLEGQRGRMQLTAPQRQLALNRFGALFRRRWVARTSCRVGYIVPLCQEYMAPKVAPTLTPPGVPLTNMTAG